MICSCKINSHPHCLRLESNLGVKFLDRKLWSKGRMKDLLKVTPEVTELAQKPRLLNQSSVRFSTYSRSSSLLLEYSLKLQKNIWKLRVLISLKPSVLIFPLKALPLSFGELRPIEHVHMYQFMISIYNTTQLWFHYHEIYKFQVWVIIALDIVIKGNRIQQTAELQLLFLTVLCWHPDELEHHLLF